MLRPGKKRSPNGVVPTDIGDTIDRTKSCLITTPHSSRTKLDG